MIRVVGFDLSLNHAAAVRLRNGKLSDYAFITDRAGDAKTGGADTLRGERLNVDARTRLYQKDKHRLLVWRVGAVAKWVYDRLLAWNPQYVGIEDYALRAEHGAHQLGELGGVVRNMLYELGIPFRLHDPTTLKMFIAHDGTCDKSEVELAVRRRWNADFTKHNSTSKSTQTSGDLADAFGIAKMVSMEQLLRAGKLDLRQLHEKEIRVFHRVTKYQPVCLLEREWIGK